MDSFYRLRHKALNIHNALNLFKISKLVRKYPLDLAHNYKLATEDFTAIYDMLKALDVDKRKKIKVTNSDLLEALGSILGVTMSKLDKDQTAFLKEMPKEREEKKFLRM